MTTQYPNLIDTSATLPSSTDNVTEIGSEAIMAMRDAIFAIEKAIGENPQGTTASLAARLANVLEPNGTFKASALIAAGLIALPITNAQIAANAAIGESKLDLDVATQLLQNQIASNDIDIVTLQQAIADIFNRFNQHVTGANFKHQSYDILLDKDFPSTTPPEFTGLTATEVGSALKQINDAHRSHINSETSGAHSAANISVDTSLFNDIPQTVENVQEALEAIDASRTVDFIYHRDDLHANGFSDWANSNVVAEYNENLRRLPLTGDADENAIVTIFHRFKMKFTGTVLKDSGVQQGDVVVILDGYGQGTYVVDDVGPRPASGSKPVLQNDELEVTRPIDNVTAIDGGIVSAEIYAASSTLLLRTNCAPTVYQTSTLDSIQFARPNAAKVVSLGAAPHILTGGTLNLRAGVNDGYREITITNLHHDRNGALSPGVLPSINTVVERLNKALKSEHFPAAAYRVGDELVIAHNWAESNDYYLTVLPSGDATTILGFDGYGAGVIDIPVVPTKTAKFFVAGKEFFDFRILLEADGLGISGNKITFSDLNPIDAGIKIGHLAQIKSHPTDINKQGTYLITGVSNTAITLHDSAGSGTIAVEIRSDAVALNELTNSNRQQLIESFVDATGRSGYNLRTSCDLIDGLTIIDISDNAREGDYKLHCDSAGADRNIYIELNGTSGPVTFVAAGFIGRSRVYFPSNIEYVDIETVAPAATVDAADLIVYQHVNEEEVLEIATVRSDGNLKLAQVIDKRLFGSTGLDEIREDVVHVHVELPTFELHSDGIIRGFDAAIYEDEIIYPLNQSLLIHGGVGYVGGVRVVVPAKQVVFPITASDKTYIICLNPLGNYVLVDSAINSVVEVKAGALGHLLPLWTTDYIALSDELSNFIDLRFFIGKIETVVRDFEEYVENRLIKKRTLTIPAADIPSFGPGQTNKVVPIGGSLPANTRILGVDLHSYTPFNSFSPFKISVGFTDEGSIADGYNSLVDEAAIGSTDSARPDGSPPTIPTGRRPNKLLPIGGQPMAKFTFDDGDGNFTATSGSITVDILYTILE
jgi:hypothetical protein